jgi:hypothetical protein
MTLAKKLRKLGFEVHAFDRYQHRVNREFDFWLTDHNRALAWHDLFTGERGRKPEHQMVKFIEERLKNRPTEVTQESFIASLVDIGWSKEEATQQWTERKSKAG